MRQIVIKQSKNGQYYFIVIARNRKILVTSETYTRKSNCKKAISALRVILKEKFFFITDTTKKK